MWRYRSLSEEEKEKLIDRIAKKIVEYEFDIPATIFLSGLRPMSMIASQLGILFAGPYLEMFGQDAYDILSFLGSPENIKELINKVEAIRNEKKEENNVEERKEKKSLLERLRSYFKFQ